MRKAGRIIFLYIPAAYILVSVLLVVLLKWMPVIGTPLMLRRALGQSEKKTRVEYRWIPLEKVSPELMKAVVAEEDTKYFEHNGFAFEEIKKMAEEHARTGKPIRGCSTISQQTAKNCFTWGGRTWVRKAFEAYYTFLIEKIWGKRRILEVYLNVAEMGPNIFGAEKASRKYFSKPAQSLTRTEAAALACSLPSPAKRNPSVSGKFLTKMRATVVKRTTMIKYPEWVRKY